MSSTAPNGVSVEEYTKNLLQAREALREFINKANCNPILVRLAWHDSATFSRWSQEGFPNCGGANGSIRFKPEIQHGGNAGLAKAVNYLKPIKEKYPVVTWADLIQLASAEALYMAGCPPLPMRYGREETTKPEECPKEGRLPDALPPFKGEPTAADHLRNVFYRMGLSDREIVALSGAHTLGRAFKNRSGVVENGYGDKTASKYTKSDCIARRDGKPGVGMSGGKAWTRNWLTFDNAYFRWLEESQDDKEILWLPTDRALHEDPKFRPHFARYAKDQNAFFSEYIEAHVKLSELGSKFSPEGGIAIDAKKHQL